MTSHDLVLFADYFQLYAYDPGMTGLRPDEWTTDDLLRKAVFAGDVVVIFTARNMDVPLRVEVLAEAPELELQGWDHIVDGALRISSGQLVIMGCTDAEPEALHMPLAAGSYRARVSMAGLDEVSEDGLDGDDRYRLQLWPGPRRDTVVRVMHEPAQPDRL